jgi:serine protease AprX
MAMTPLRTLQGLVVRALEGLGGTATPKQVIDRIVADGFTPTTEDKAPDPASGKGTAWHTRIRVARRHLSDDGRVRVNRGRWELTAQPREPADADPPTPTPVPQPTPFMPSVISAALTDPRIQQPKTTRGIGITAEDDSMSVIIELNVALPGGAFWTYQKLQGLFEDLHLVDDDHPMPEQFDEYVHADLPMSTIEELVKTDIDRSGSANRLIYRVWPNFRVHTQIDESVRTIKADAAIRAFNARGKGITWAVIDSGIDASHPHFITGNTLHDPAVADLHRDFTVKLDPGSETADSALQDSYGSTGHGTGVASIIAGYLPPDYAENDLEVLSQQLGAAGDPNPILSPRKVAPGNLAGMAPDTRLVSLKVISDDSDSSDVLTVMAALRYVMQINDKDQAPRVHGVNLSLGYGFDPAWFACGQSPLCQAVDRLVRSGVVVVVAAGNTGFATFGTFSGRRDGGLTLSINDPGNADRAITVGATHRTSPYTYGVSYFSSKGPTGDGRQKPDLVAPGERITVATAAVDAAGARRATYSDVSGTSFAAPHVSGAVAAFLSVRREFVGQPERVKQILVDSAQPLGRERQFEGGGLLDIMRALQSV